jgi:hypothetical protein
MRIGHMKTNDFPWNVTKIEFLIVIYCQQNQIECRFKVDY